MKRNRHLEDSAEGGLIDSSPAAGDTTPRAAEREHVRLYVEQKHRSESHSAMKGAIHAISNMLNHQQRLSGNELSTIRRQLTRLERLKGARVCELHVAAQLLLHLTERLVGLENPRARHSYAPEE